MPTPNAFPTPNPLVFERYYVQRQVLRGKKTFVWIDAGNYRTATAAIEDAKTMIGADIRVVRLTTEILYSHAVNE